jgi:hypothetical protein
LFRSWRLTSDPSELAPTAIIVAARAAEILQSCTLNPNEADGREPPLHDHRLAIPETYDRETMPGFAAKYGKSNERRHFLNGGILKNEHLKMALKVALVPF